MVSPCSSAGSIEAVCSCKSTVYNGLEGVIVAETTVSTVGIANVGLTYRGYPVTQLINSSCFEEVAFLLISGNLPHPSELLNFRAKIAQGRNLSLQMKALCELFEAAAHPMDIIRTAVGFYACSGSHTNPECSDNAPVIDRAGQLIGLIPSVITYWHNFATLGRRIDTVAASEIGVAEHFLTCLRNTKPSRLAYHCLDKTLIAYAEHDLNASTFSARVTASTLSDYFSCIVSAIGTLKGPLHGGANQAALEMLLAFDSVKSVPERLSQMLDKKEKVMGFGHRVYKHGDPRHLIMKNLAHKLAVSPDVLYKDPALFEIAETLEKEMIARKGIYPNLDFCASLVYKQLGIPTSLFTVLFAIGRTAGWSAHIQEQNHANKLIRPKSKYTGHEVREFISIV